MSIQAYYAVTIDRNGAESAGQTLSTPRQIRVDNPNSHAVFIRWASGTNAKRIGPNASRRFDFPRGYEPGAIFAAREGLGSADTFVHVEVVPWAAIVADIGGGDGGAGAAAGNEPVVVSRMIAFGVARAADTTLVHAAHAGGGADVFPGPITSPGAADPRNVTVTFSGGWTAGDISVNGLDHMGNAVSENFGSSPGNTVVGNVVFETVTEISKTMPGAGTASVGIGDKLGIPDEITIDAASAARGDGLGWQGTSTTRVTIDAPRRAVTAIDFLPDGVGETRYTVPITHDHS